MRELLAQFNPLTLVATLVLLLFTVFAVLGCKTAPQETTAHLAVTFATAKYVERAGTADARAARAVRIAAVIDLIENLGAGDAVTVEALRDYALQRLPVDLSPADRVLAGTLIDLAAAELRARVGEGVIPADARLKVKTVLQWIREGAAYYLPPAAAT